MALHDGILPAPETGAGSDCFDCRRTLTVGDRAYDYFSLPVAGANGLGQVSLLPYSLKVVLENLLRREGGEGVDRQQALAVGRWADTGRGGQEIAFRPGRILMQDLSGIPLLADLAAMRDKAAQMGIDPARIEPKLPLDLVVDHSLIVDVSGRNGAVAANMEKEFARNRERYRFIRWGGEAIESLRIFPPGMGICHQVNLEYLARVVRSRDSGRKRLAFPDTVIGMDSHTPMVNALGVLGWGVGGLEAGAAMLGEPVSLCLPEVVGCRLTGRLRPGVTTTDLALTVVKALRERGVVQKFVEFCGDALENLALAQRASLANMAPEYGATVGFFPIDQETLSYLALTGRKPETIALVKAYARAQGLWRSSGNPEPRFTDVVDIDLASVTAGVSGPRRPEQWMGLAQLPAAVKPADEKGARRPAPVPGAAGPEDGAVAIAAISGCTHTSNPRVMLQAGLLAQKAVARGLCVKSWVKTSLAPGSAVVGDYLAAAGLQPALDRLGFHLVGFGCTSCVGNSGPLRPEMRSAIEKRGIVAAAVLCSNRNFEGRIHPDCRQNYLVAPHLVVAFALAGTVDIDLTREPLGCDAKGRPVYLADLLPEEEEIDALAARVLTPDCFRQGYRRICKEPPAWKALGAADRVQFQWDPASSYIRRPPFFDPMPSVPASAGLSGMRPLAILGDAVNTDLISPVGQIAPESVAGTYLRSCGIEPEDFNTFGARRANHEVMVRGTFSSPRLRNRMVPGHAGGWTRHMPSGLVMTIYDAAARYRGETVPLVVVAGRQYGAGSSRDWAAKGTALLGVRAVIARSFERIHRSNLVGMGVLPLEFLPETGSDNLGLDGSERFDLQGVGPGLEPGGIVRCTIRRQGQASRSVNLRCRLDTRAEIDYWRNGGILQYVLCHMKQPAGFGSQG